MSRRGPDVEIAAAARAKELRFAEKPRVRIGAYSDQRATAVSSSQRENLPDEIEPGVTYRNIAVRWSLAARFEDDDDPGGP